MINAGKTSHIQMLWEAWGDDRPDPPFKEMKMELPENLRAFIAIDLPETTKQQLLDIQQELRSQCPDGVMYWQPVYSFHLTLFWLGATPLALRENIGAALVQVGQKSTPFSLTIGELGTFEKETYPWVFFVKVEDSNGNLQRLYEEVVDAMARFDYKADYPVYHPHITLCKDDNRGASLEALAPFRAVAQNFHIPTLGSVTVDEMVFYHTASGQGRSKYIPLQTVPLSGS
jgi:2'-5' RNA ligase